MTCGNLTISFTEENENLSRFTIGLFLDNPIADTIDATRTYVAISKMNL